MASSMMQRIFGIPLLLVGVILVSRTPVQAQAQDTELPVSLERIRAALKEQPAILRVPEASGETPTFHLEVREPQFVLQPVDEKAFDPTFGLPSVGELMMDGVGKVQSAVVNYKRGRARRRARKEVDEALAAFCASRSCPTSTTEK